MDEKDPNTSVVFMEYVRQAMPYISTIGLWAWGGVVNHISKLRKGGVKFKGRELAFDLIVSTFAGLMTFYFCQSAGVSDTMQAVLIAISGHMGTRAIAGFEVIYRRIIGIPDNEKV